MALEQVSCSSLPSSWFSTATEEQRDTSLDDVVSNNKRRGKPARDGTLHHVICHDKDRPHSSVFKLLCRLAMLHHSLDQSLEKSMERSKSPESEADAPFNVSDSLAPPRANRTARTTAVTFDGLLKDPLLLKEDLKDGCGGQLWPAGMVLAKYILCRHTLDMSEKTIVELGAGGGLVGLSIARGCEISSPLHITDQEPMLSLMKDNIRLNNLDATVTASVLNWGEPTPDHIPPQPDIILAADSVYFEPAFPLLITTLEDLLGPGSLCYFCFKRRRRADFRFLKMAKKIFDVAKIRDDPNAATNYPADNSRASSNGSAQSLRGFYMDFN
ncbi:uncharacterized protein N7459_009803 [Penicillium hispanicum]|uniref:uncharacterized protein n=1 Tax=Penicillium hispanicum TaxID=1080232 RepID=UPI0025403E13|nr:uncharacterized protein N7459_009803 [Penicillium hispanicum]KAJ5570373.1 hypothetical protein N7459_009803 [Penicillium hispanicum]